MKIKDLGRRWLESELRIQKQNLRNSQKYIDELKDKESSYAGAIKDMAEVRQEFIRILNEKLNKISGEGS